MKTKKSKQQKERTKKREVFAVLAMQRMANRHMGEYSKWDLENKKHLNHPKWVAEAAVNYADALLDALESVK